MKRRSSLALALVLLCPVTLGATQAFAETEATNVVNITSETTETTETSEVKEEVSNKKTIPIQMLGVNDYHGALDTPGTATIDGIRYPNSGKAAVLAAYLNQAESEFKSANEKGYTERIQAGDLVGASPANSALLRDEPTMKVFTEMNFTLGTLGNHEFDKGLAEYIRILEGRAPSREAMGNISDDLWEAINGYPRVKSSQEIAVANIKNKTNGPHGEAGGQPYDLPPYVVKTYSNGQEDVKVGYIGVVTKEFPNLVLAEHTKDFEVIDEGEAVAQYTKELREDGVNAVVVISHVAATSSGDQVKGDVVDMMNTVDKLDPDNGVDVVFAGHNHQHTNGVIPREDKNDVRVVQSTSQGKAYIDVQGELDPETKDFVDTPKATVKATEGDKITPDANIQAIVDDASKRIEPISNEVIGSVDTEKVPVINGKPTIVRAGDKNDESPLGNLITDAQLYMANHSNLVDSQGNPVKADFAITNSGGIRADLSMDDQGGVTWGSAQAVQPFGNILQVVEMTGKDIKEALNQQYNNKKTGYSLQVSGLEYGYKGTVATGDGSFEVTEARRAYDGVPIIDDETYNVIINDFLFGGGDGFTAFTKGKLITAMDTDTETFVNYFKEMKKNDEKVVPSQTGRKKEQLTTSDELKEATKVDPIRKGDKVITGKSIPGAEVAFANTHNKTLGEGITGEDGKFKVELTEPVTERGINFFVSYGYTKLHGPESVIFPEGDYIKDGSYVKVTKGDYDIFSNFDWKKRGTSKDLMGETLQARGRYEHENKKVYYSLYDSKGQWKGYLDAEATEKTTPQGAYIKDGRYVTITSKNYDVWSNFDWKKRGSSKDMVNTTYQARGQYKHFNGATYLSLYDTKGNWQGYINQNAVKAGQGKQGAYIADGRYVTVTSKNYDVWSNFNWQKRTTTKMLYQQTYQAKGKYQHFNGSTYYSLYDDKGVWKGYVNANATKAGDGKQGAYIPYGKQVEITKKGYNTWSNFNWQERYKTDKMIGTKYTAKGVYYHINGATYYSLYDSKGTWHGYINANAVKVK